MKHLRRILFCALALCCCSAPAFALTPDEILLVTNQNVPEGVRLASIYTDLRHIPADHTLALSLPKTDMMDFDDYEQHVVPEIRQYLTDHHLQQQIKCIVTFYGVPFKIAARHNSPDDLAELKQLQAQEDKVLADFKQAVIELESQATIDDPTYKPPTLDNLHGLEVRAENASNICGQHIETITSSADKAKAIEAFVKVLSKVGGMGAVDAHYGPEQRATLHQNPDEDKKWATLHQTITDAATQAGDLQTKRYDRDSRSKLRDVVANNFGLNGIAQVLEAQITYFDTNDTNAATDNELALLWWGYYPRWRWQINPLNLHYHARTPPVMMVMRLDAPTPEVVEKLMHTSIEVEKTGLTGTVALDARGMEPADANGKPDPYGIYDEKIRHLAVLLRAHTNLNVVLDNKPAVFTPRSVRDVAIYCGWYSLNNYIPGCDFNPGAVGFHIASLEMVALHGNTPTGWVHGLLNDGVVATLGATSEPYLSAFPNPDEFFPLLLTGKQTLAEVYWETTPMTSWQIACIGDPLYTPYQANPAMKIEDLPQDLQAVFTPAPPTPSN